MNIKAIQIQEMDRMYARAYLAIVACAGANADYGLPTKSQSRAEITASRYLALTLKCFPPCQHCLLQSTTPSGGLVAGHTKREFYLTDVCCFTYQQVYFACSSMSYFVTNTDAGGILPCLRKKSGGPQ